MSGRACGRRLLVILSSMVLPHLLFADEGRFSVGLHVRHAWDGLLQDDAAVVGLFPRWDGQSAVDERDVLNAPGDLCCRPKVDTRLRAPAPGCGPADQQGAQHCYTQVAHMRHDPFES